MNHARSYRWKPAYAVALALFAMPAGAAPAPPGPQVTVDARDIETLAKFAKQAQAVANTWYPRIAKILGVSPVPAERVTIRISLESGGVAGTSGRRIEVSARYVARNPNDLGMIVHELTHVVQAYPKYDPVWLGACPRIHKQPGRDYSV